MEYILLSVAVLLGAAKNIFTKIVKKKSASFFDTMKMNVITFAAAFCLVFLMGIARVKTTFCVPWLLTVLYAVATLGSQIALMIAVDIGSVSISALFYSCGFLLPTIFGSIYYKEKLTFFHSFGIILIIVAFLCSVKKEKGKNFSLAWLIAALGGLLFSGSAGIIQKFFTKEYAHYYLDNFLCVAFLWIILFSAILTFFAYRRKNVCKKPTHRQEEAIDDDKNWCTLFVQYAFTIVLGMIMGLVNKTNTYLSGILPSVIVFPVINGGVILTTTVLSFALFKEKLTLFQKIGICIGIMGIVSITVLPIII